ncbi:hypothetical protein M900_2549 [Bacteriovorax sp. Seq25_V]|nr:hypothetical protein M900_2549 [Bacteriovorax sp. Seq25_V]
MILRITVLFVISHFVAFECWAKELNGNDKLDYTYNIA